MLIDSMQGGSGVAMDWARLQPPQHLGSRGWMLAGGLHPGNVAKVLSTRPELPMLVLSSKKTESGQTWMTSVPAHMTNVDLRAAHQATSEPQCGAVLCLIAVRLECCA